MRQLGTVRVAALVASGLLWVAAASAQDVTLTEDCEEGFRQLIRMAQGGRLGDNVTNASVAAVGSQVRVELVRAGAPATVLMLTPKRSPRAVSRYFDVAPGDGATVRDVERVGRALDDVFLEDPFRTLGYERLPDSGPIAPFADAWAYGGSRAVLRGLELHMMVLASLRYTVVVIVAVALGVLATVVLLWGSIPPRPAAKS